MLRALLLSLKRLLPRPGAPLVSLVWAIALKGLLVLWTMHAWQLWDQPGWLKPTGDSESYTRPIENWIAYGTYAFDMERPITYYGRMPGLIIPYGVFRYLGLQEAEAQRALLLFHLLFEALATVAFAAWAHRLFAHWVVYQLAFLAYSLTHLGSYFIVALAPESLALSALTLALYTLYRARNDAGWRWPLLAGLLLTWAVFLKAYLVLLLPVAGLYLFWGWRWRVAMAFTLPFLLIDGAWILRNYTVTGRAEPLADIYAGYGYDASEIALGKLVGAWGCDRIEWQPKAEIRWFTQAYRHQGIGPRVDSLPTRVFVPAYTTADLAKFRHELRVLRQATPPGPAYQSKDSLLAAQANGWRKAYISARPLEYYLVNPLRLIIRLVNHSGVYHLTATAADRLPRWQWLLKAFQSLLHHLFTWVAWLLLLGLVLYGLGLRTDWLPEALLLLGFLVMQLLVFGVLFRTIEYRYCATFYLIGMATWVLVTLVVGGRLTLRRWGI